MKSKGKIFLKIDKLITNIYLRELFPFLFLIPEYLILPKEITFFIYTGCIIYLISGYWQRSDIKIKNVLLRGCISVLILVIIICTIVFVKFHHKLEVDFISKILPFIGICAPTFTILFYIGYILKNKIKQSGKGRFIFVILLINLIVVNAGAFGWAFQCSLGGLIFMIGGYILASEKLNQNIYVLFFLSGPLFLIESFFILKDSLYHLLPIPLIIILTTLIGIFLKILYCKEYQKVVFYSILSIGIILSTLGYFVTLNWEEFIFSNKINSIIDKLTIKFKTLDGQELNESNFLGKITVLYLWTSSCHVCFEKMPELEKLTQTFVNNHEIQIFSVIIPTSIIDTNSILLVEKLSKKYKINYAISLDNSSIVTKNFNFNAFPIVLIIDRNGDLTYKGRFNNNKVIFINNITTILNRVSQDAF